MPAKRALSATLALLLAVSFAAPSGARALTEHGFTYTQTGGAVTITGCEATCPTTLDIPAVLGGYFVTAIGYAAFNNNSVTTLTIPSTVRVKNQMHMMGPKRIPTLPVPSFWNENKKARMRMVMGKTYGVRCGAAICRPSTELMTEMAGVIILSP